MTRDVLFIQGGGEGAHDYDAALAENLQSTLGPGYRLRYPRMPNEGSPDDQAWKSSLAKEIAALGDRVIVVAHSVGAAIFVRSLAKGGGIAKIAGLFLIAAPFIGEGGWSIPGFEPMDKASTKLSHDLPIYLYHGRADESVPFAHVELYAKAIPWAQVRRLDDADHQLNNDLSKVAADIRQLG